MRSDKDLPGRILRAALECFLAGGVKKTGVEAVAATAGTTRVSVYRYFGGRKALTRAAFGEIVGAFEDAARAASRSGGMGIQEALGLIRRRLSALPKGNLIPAFRELGRIYPDVREELEARRSSAAASLIRCFSKPGSNIRFREDIDPRFAAAFLSETILSITGGRAYEDLPLSQEEVFSNFETLFLHGMLSRGRQTASGRKRR